MVTHALASALGSLQRASAGAFLRSPGCPTLSCPLPDPPEAGGATGDNAADLLGAGVRRAAVTSCSRLPATSQGTGAKAVQPQPQLRAAAVLTHACGRSASQPRSHLQEPKGPRDPGSPPHAQPRAAGAKGTSDPGDLEQEERPTPTPLPPRAATRPRPRAKSRPGSS